jgi:hypothetical protein
MPPRFGHGDELFFLAATFNDMIARLEYLLESQRRVEPLYKLEKAGPLRINGAPNPEGRAFIDTQLIRGGEMLGAVWLTAWRQAAPDTYLRSDMIKRAAAHP